MELGSQAEGFRNTPGIWRNALRLLRPNDGAQDRRFTPRIDLRNDHFVGIFLPQTSFRQAVYYPTPSAFSLRCSAERSMPTNSAVREILPEKRLIWAIR